MKAYTVVFGRADLLGGQLALLRKNCPDVTELRVINNGPGHISADIESECRRLGLSAFSSIPPKGMINCESHAYALNQAWQMWIAPDDDEALILDFDIFPVRPTSPLSWLRDAHLAAFDKTKVLPHPWPGLLAIRRDIPHRAQLSFTPCYHRGQWSDTGGFLGFYLERHPELTWKRLEKIELPQWVPEFAPSEMYDGAWLHYRAGSNWQHNPDGAELVRTGRLFGAIAEALGAH